MLQSLANVFRIPDLRKKILYTVLMVLLFRIGAHIPVPFVSAEKIRERFEEAGNLAGGIFSTVDMFTGGAFSQMTVMALGIMPYVSASIILQLMTLVIPQLEKLSKEGESGRKKINQFTRYGTVVLAFLQACAIGVYLIKSGVVSPLVSDHSFLFTIMTGTSIAAGTTFLMWIGDRITERGIGNGTSLIIAFGIMAHYPGSLLNAGRQIAAGSMDAIWLPIIVGLSILATAAIIMTQEGARKIPVQHAKRVVGRRVQMAHTNYLPLKVNTAGVIPVIFSSAILTLPATVLSWIGTQYNMMGLGSWFEMYSPHNLYEAFGLQKESIFLLLKVANLHTILFAILTIFFCYFYTAVTFNPQDLADNLKKVGAFIPGYRPGKQTADYIDMVLTRITTAGAVFLVVIALVPQVLTVAFGLDYRFADLAGGTGLIIVVGVVLDTMKQVESQLLLRHYDGFKRRPGAGGGRRWTARQAAQ